MIFRGTTTELKDKLNLCIDRKQLKEGIDYICTIEEYKDKRNNNQNALYWELLNQYAKYGGYSINRLHNEMLSRYGVKTPYYALIPESEEIEELTDIHLEKSSKTEKGKNGITYIYCRILKGSHELNKEQMSRLIEGLTNEMVGVGIEVNYFN